MAQRIQKILNRSGLFTYWNSTGDNVDSYKEFFFIQEIIAKVANLLVGGSSYRDAFLLEKNTESNLMSNWELFLDESEINLNEFLKKSRAKELSKNYLVFTSKTWVVSYNNEIFLTVFLYKSRKKSEYNLKKKQEVRLKNIKKYTKYKQVTKEFRKEYRPSWHTKTKNDVVNSAPDLTYYYKKILNQKFKSSQYKKSRKLNWGGPKTLNQNTNLWDWKQQGSKPIYSPVNLGLAQILKKDQTKKIILKSRTKIKRYDIEKKI